MSKLSFGSAGVPDELKEQLYRTARDLTVRLGTTPNGCRQIRLKVVDSSIPIPDLRIEFETRATEQIDLELATREYRSEGLTAQARSGFRFFGRYQGRVMDQRGNHREDFRSMNIPRMYTIAVESFGYSESEATGCAGLPSYSPTLTRGQQQPPWSLKTTPNVTFFPCSSDLFTLP